MKIIVASDAARCPQELERIKVSNPGTDLFLYLGNDLTRITGWSILPDGCILSVGGHRILVTPKLPGVKEAVSEAAVHQCDLVLWYSPWTAWCVEIRGILVVNPGSLHHSANQMPRSCAVLDLAPGRSPACTIAWQKGLSQGTERLFDPGFRQGGKRYPDA